MYVEISRWWSLAKGQQVERWIQKTQRWRSSLLFLPLRRICYIPVQDTFFASSQGHTLFILFSL